MDGSKRSMPKLTAPLKLAPIFKPKVWGRNDLEPLFDHPAAGEGAKPSWQRRARPDTDEPIGEAWITDDSSRFLTGPLAETTLGEASHKFRSRLYGANWKGGRFPILAKYLFTNDWLSVQVHPDDRYARNHESGSLGKCEMWYILHADPGAEFLLGLKPNTTREMLRAACERGASKELLQRFRPKTGEVVFVPPGTAHALGPGLVLFEAEQNSNVTYRLDDFGRPGLDGKPRPLHLEKGLEVTQPELPVYRNLPRIVTREPFGFRRFLVASRYFAVEELALQKTAHFTPPAERAETLAIVAGEGRVENSAGWLGYQEGDAWLVPPGSDPYRIAPTERTRLIKFYIPNLDEDFRRIGSRRSVKSSELEKLFFKS